jgi:hypothetical protein
LYHNKQHDIARAAGNKKKATFHFNMSGRAADLMNYRNDLKDLRDAERRIKTSRQFVRASRVLTKRDKYEE